MPDIDPNKLLVVIVGVSRYEDSTMDLAKIDASVKKFKDWLIEGFIVPKDNVILITSESELSRCHGAKLAAELENKVIGHELNASGNTLLVYWAGHGLVKRRAGEEAHLLMTSDYKKTSPAAVELSHFLVYLREPQFQFSRQIVFIEACRVYVETNLDIGGHRFTIGHQGSANLEFQELLVSCKTGETSSEGRFVGALLDCFRVGSAAELLADLRSLEGKLNEELKDLPQRAFYENLLSAHDGKAKRSLKSAFLEEVELTDSEGRELFQKVFADQIEALRQILDEQPKLKNELLKSFRIVSTPSVDLVCEIAYRIHTDFGPRFSELKRIAEKVGEDGDYVSEVAGSFVFFCLAPSYAEKLRDAIAAVGDDESHRLEFEIPKKAQSAIESVIKCWLVGRSGSVDSLTLMEEKRITEWETGGAEYSNLVEFKERLKQAYGAEVKDDVDLEGALMDDFWNKTPFHAVIGTDSSLYQQVMNDPYLNSSHHIGSTC